MPKIKVNGREIEAPPGKKLLEVLTDEKITVPYYCWHPGLKPHGNCRMCLVKVSNSRKLEVSCTYPVTEGLEVTTEGPEIEVARKSVLEFMLVNHPLDCPVCDKAGECMLQDHTFDHRKGVSRFEEDKVLKGTWDVGPKIRIWGNRCISCTRCVRFLEDEVGTGELSITNRGDHSVADIHPDVPVDNPMSKNIVDICPVGALIDKDFMYQARVWFAQRKDSICTGCSRGCNIVGTTWKNEMRRIQPRHNAEVNGHWMCDGGRDFAPVHHDRLAEPKGSLQELAKALDLGRGQVGIVASTAHTLEELFLLKKLADATRAVTGFLTKVQGERWVSKAGFAIETDKTPNTRGAAMLFGGLAPHRAVVDAIEAGKVQVLVVANQISTLDWPADLVAAARKVKTVAVADFQRSALSDAAGIVIPVTCWAEKDGTYMNRDGRVQRGRVILPAVPQARPGDKPGTQRHTETVNDIAWLQEVLVALKARERVVSADGVFREAFPGYDHARVGANGLVFATPPDGSVPAAAPSPVGSK
jgi:NADH-quinone oxidoreductase subunit G